MADPKHIPSAYDRRRIAALAVMPERGVLRVYLDPSKRQPSTVERVRLAAIKLGLPPPRVTR